MSNNKSQNLCTNDRTTMAGTLRSNGSIDVDGKEKIYYCNNNANHNYFSRDVSNGNVKVSSGKVGNSTGQAKPAPSNTPAESQSEKNANAGPVNSLVTTREAETHANTLLETMNLKRENFQKQMSDF